MMHRYQPYPSCKRSGSYDQYDQSPPNPSQLSPSTEKLAQHLSASVACSYQLHQYNPAAAPPPLRNSHHNLPHQAAAPTITSQYHLPNTQHQPVAQSAPTTRSTSHPAGVFRCRNREVVSTVYNNLGSSNGRGDPFSFPVPLPHEMMSAEHYNNCAQTFIRRRNERERERVRCVNQGYDSLRKCLPLPAREKRISKVEILRSAIRYIDALQDLLGGSVGGSSPQNSKVKYESD